ncbi:hypothetical protein ED733_004261 [Metarhizium rileyi]|uniref:Uncharacterized protein n=1 Tax=Metarhizium rileyi (strain RCEF 4871) TaxID=1649241 RepID=A0A5C6GGY6_METRR|nr:hypothetical protein ED733_004261 [Metarhizium rileyi]
MTTPRNCREDVLLSKLSNGDYLITKFLSIKNRDVGRGVLQQCNTCKWAICKECSQAIRGEKKNTNHILDDKSVSWDPPQRESRTSTKATTARGARRAKRNQRSVVDETPAVHVGVLEESSCQNVTSKGKESKATQTDLGYRSGGYLIIPLVVDEERAADILTGIKHADGLKPSRENRAIPRSAPFELPSVLYPKPEEQQYQPGNPLNRHLKPVSQAASRNYVHSHTHGYNPEFSTHKAMDEHVSVSNWLPPLRFPPKERKYDQGALGHERPHDRESYAEPPGHRSYDKTDYYHENYREAQPPRLYETSSTHQHASATYTGEEKVGREWPGTGRSTTAATDLAPLYQDSNETKHVLGKRTWSAAGSPAPGATPTSNSATPSCEPPSKKRKAKHNDAETVSR